MEVKKVIEKIDDLIEDHSMPKRIKVVLEKIGKELKNDIANPEICNKSRTEGSSLGQDVAVRVTSAIYELEDITNDINIPMHAKTALWDLVSDLEAIKHEEE